MVMDERVMSPQAIDTGDDNHPMWEAGDLDLDAVVLSPSMSELRQAIIVWAVELLHADAGEIFLWDQDKGHLIESIGYGSMESQIGLVLEPDLCYRHIRSARRRCPPYLA
jgi:hypothetical protein